MVVVRGPWIVAVESFVWRLQRVVGPHHHKSSRFHQFDAVELIAGLGSLILHLQYFEIGMPHAPGDHDVRYSASLSTDWKSPLDF